uniref:Family with sequence similarity 237 member A n=1 Tax=Echeneis naucrates TaxID=173247 RepID=A0A665X6W2_ECHNA
VHYFTGKQKIRLIFCMCAVPPQGHRPGHPLAQADTLTARRADPQCWDSSSAQLLEIRTPTIADTVPAFWDLMMSLRSSDDSKHTALFSDLARVFWDMYLDCVMSRSHGLGRRHLTAVHSLIPDSKCSAKHKYFSVSFLYFVIMDFYFTAEL